MSVLIKGMDMPEDCIKCPFCLFTGTYWKCLADGSHADFGGTCRPPGCPLVLVPPHGRLIDADKLEQEMINGIRAGNHEDGYGDYPHINNVDDCVECVRYADTIIEAEEGEEE